MPERLERRFRGDEEAAIERMVGDVPGMLRRARLLREETADPRVQVALLAPRWLGRMAAVAALVGALALLWPASSDQAAAGTSLDRWVVSGTAADEGDPVLGALLR